MHARTSSSHRAAPRNNLPRLTNQKGPAVVPQRENGATKAQRGYENVRVTSLLAEYVWNVWTCELEFVCCLASFALLMSALFSSFSSSKSRMTSKWPNWAATRSAVFSACNPQSTSHRTARLLDRPKRRDQSGGVHVNMLCLTLPFPLLTPSLPPSLPHRLARTPCLSYRPQLPCRAGAGRPRCGFLRQH